MELPCIVFTFLLMVSYTGVSGFVTVFSYDDWCAMDLLHAPDFAKPAANALNFQMLSTSDFFAYVNVLLQSAYRWLSISISDALEILQSALSHRYSGKPLIMHSGAAIGFPIKTELTILFL